MMVRKLLFCFGFGAVLLSGCNRMPKECRKYSEKELLESIADYFNVDIDYLVGRKETTERIPIIEKAPAHSARAMEFISLFENLPEDKKDALLSYASFLSEQAPKDS